MDYIISWCQSGYCFPAKPWELVFNKVIAVVYISTYIIIIFLQANQAYFLSTVLLLLLLTYVYGW